MNSLKEAIVVTDMKSLYREKARLRALCHIMEVDAKNRVNYVKKNYGSMAFNSLFPNAGTQAGAAKMFAAVAKNMFKSSGFKTGIITAIITILEFVGVRKLTELVQQLFHKKDKEEDKKEDEKD